MKTKMLLLAGLLLVVMVGEAHAAADKELLKGIRGLQVLVERVDPDLENYGVTQAQLRTRVEVKLRQAGIKVITPEELEKMPAVKRAETTVTTPTLYLRIASVKVFDLPMYAINVSLGVLEGVTFVRDEKMSALATTWQVSSPVLIGATRFRDFYDAVDYRMDIFVNDYLAANPK